MSDKLNEQMSDSDDTPLQLDDIFCVGIGQVIEIAKMLGFNKEQFIETLNVCWDVDSERREKEEKIK